MAEEGTYLTTEGLHRLEQEMEHLRGVRRSEVAQKIQEAKEIGGTVDNAEYEEAKNEQAFIEGRILTLEAMLKTTVVIPEHENGSSDIVEIGSRVTVLMESNGKKATYTIVGSVESAPAEGFISNESPIGKAVLGKRAGDVVKVQVPAGTQQVKVVEVL